MSETKVCICVPCFNNEATIGDSLESIINQDYSNLIIKVFDNASSDNTKEILNSYIECGRHIEIHTNENTISLEENFNSCIAASEGEYSAIFHADDIYEPTIITEQVDFLNRNKNSLAVSTHANLIDGNGKLIGERMLPPELTHASEAELDRELLITLSFKYGNFVTCPSILFRTDTLKKHVQHFDSGNFKSSADFDVWLRIVEKGNFGFINKPLLFYRKSDSSFSYKLARVRLEDHDLFLVLDDIILNCRFSDEFCKKIVKYRDFLLMKDRANTNLNKLILQRNDFQSIGLMKNLPLFFESRFHTKFYLLAILTVLIILIPKSTFLSKLVKIIKFNNV